MTIGVLPPHPKVFRPIANNAIVWTIRWPILLARLHSQTDSPIGKNYQKCTQKQRTKAFWSVAAKKMEIKTENWEQIQISHRRFDVIVQSKSRICRRDCADGWNEWIWRRWHLRFAFRSLFQKLHDKINRIEFWEELELIFN